MSSFSCANAMDDGIHCLIGDHWLGTATLNTLWDTFNTSQKALFLFCCCFLSLSLILHLLSALTYPPSTIYVCWFDIWLECVCLFLLCSNEQFKGPCGRVTHGGKQSYCAFFSFCFLTTNRVTAVFFKPSGAFACLHDLNVIIHSRRPLLPKK